MPTFEIPDGPTTIQAERSTDPKNPQPAQASAVYSVTNTSSDSVVGRLMILQPNVRLLPGEYWDFFDHHTPLTEKSLAEALLNLDMQLVQVIDRFLPYTTKSRLPQSPHLVRLYLKFPLAWKLLGKQSFLVATKR